MCIEYTNKKRKKKNIAKGDKFHWYNFAGKINPGRNYTMFAVLAQVRGEYENSFEPKGKINLSELGSASIDELYISVSENPVEWGYSIRSEQATKLVNLGSQVIEHNGKPIWVENPNFHSHSWMNTKELEKAFNIYRVHAFAEFGYKVNIPIEYQAILSAMKTLEAKGENEVRIVFWFDS